VRNTDLDQAIGAMRGRMRCYALKLTRNTSQADDLTQSTILRALEKEYQFQRGTNLFSWMSTIMIHMFIANKRRNRVVFVPYEDIEQQPPNQEAYMMLQDALRMADTTALEYALDDKSYQEYADDLHIPIGTVRSRLHRSRQKMKEVA